MTKTEKAVTWAIEIANDPAHGYDQDERNTPQEFIDSNTTLRSGDEFQRSR